MLDGQRYLSLDAVKANRDALLGFTREHYPAALAIAFVTYVGATAFSLPGGLVLSLTMGFIFGRWAGTVLVVFAATIGATLVFLAARYLFADAARRRMGALGEKISAGFTENAFSYLLFLRLVPLFPFFLVNLAPAFTGISLRTYVLGTFIGIIPGSFVYVNLGQTLGRIDSLSGLVSTETLGAFMLLGMFALVPVFVRKWRSGRAAGHDLPNRISRRVALLSSRSTRPQSRCLMHATLPLLRTTDFPPIARRAVDTLQVNLGYRCNQACHHCHVNAGPDRKEMMARATVDLVLDVLAARGIGTLDVTGGAPELNPHFRHLVHAARAQGVHVIDRCNLTIVNEPGFEDLARFLADEGVEITASLPCYTRENVDRQRGDHVFESSILACRSSTRKATASTAPISS